MKYKFTFLIILYIVLSKSPLCAQTPINFTWEGAATGNKAVWSVDDSIRIYANIGGVSVKSEIIDPFKLNTTSRNPSDYGDYTKTNTFYGPGSLAFQISSEVARQPVCFNFTFSEPVFLNRFNIWDIDLISSPTFPFNSFQDSIQLFGYADTGRVALNISPMGLSPVFDIFGQGVRAKYIVNSNGVPHTDPNGAILVSSPKPIIKFSICYSNGSQDDGMSNSQAIKFKDFDVTPAFAPLPVTLLDMHAKWESEMITNLSWTTAQEVNNDHFEVLLSEDGVDYTNVGIVKSFGNSSSKHQYNYSFKNEIKGISYIALRQKDNDGKFQNLGVKTLQSAGNISELTIFPNPVKDVLTIRNSNENDSNIRLSILNMQGAEIRNVSLTALKNQNIDLDVSSLPSGHYIVQMKVNGLTSSHKLIKL